MLSIIKVPLQCIDDQSANSTFITYENIELFVFLKETLGAEDFYGMVYIYIHIYGNF